MWLVFRIIFAVVVTWISAIVAMEINWLLGGSDYVVKGGETEALVMGIVSSIVFIGTIWISLWFLFPRKDLKEWWKGTKQIIQNQKSKINRQVRSNLTPENDTKLKVTSETTRTEVDQTKDPTARLEKMYENAFLILKYNEKARYNWEKLKSVSLEFQIEFLVYIEKNPKKDTDVPTKNILTKALRPYRYHSANKALLEATKISVEAYEEFKRVYALMGTGENAKEILKKIKEDFAPQIALSELEKIMQKPSNEIFSVLGREPKAMILLKELGYSISRKERFKFVDCTIRPPNSDTLTNIRHDIRIRNKEEFVNFLNSEIKVLRELHSKAK